jgi:hypothetical protein
MKKHWLILGGVILLIGLGGLLALALLAGFFIGHEAAAGKHPALPIYKTEQSASSHTGYLRDTLTCGNDVYVNDYEEACLQLANPDPSQSIGYIGWVGNAHVCVIPGQPATAYVAGDCGSEMPAFEPFRNVKQPPFDWRAATFRQMDFLPFGGRSNWRQSTNAEIIAEIVRVLRDGKPVEFPSFTFVAITMNTNPATLRLTSDQLPGLQFCPPIYQNGDGNIYIAESFMLDGASGPTKLHARWVPAGPMLTEWLKGP